MAAIGGRIRRNTLAGSRTVRNDACELVAQYQRPRKAGIADARLFVPMQIRSTQPNGCNSEQNLTWPGRRGRLRGDPDVASGVNAGSFDERLPGGHFRVCP